MKLAIALAAALIVLAPNTAASQTRRRSTPRTSTSSAASRAAPVVRAGKTRVANQVKTLTKFTYLLGGVARGIEQTDAAISKNQASPAIIEQSRQSKATVNASFRTLREDLDKLEVDFRNTPELQRYYIKLAGSASGAAAAETLAASGQFEKAGRALLDVVSRLADVLVEMP